MLIVPSVESESGGGTRWCGTRLRHGYVPDAGVILTTHGPQVQRDLKFRDVEKDVDGF
jgi:hypothetical protein